MLALDRKEGLAVADAAGFQPFQFLRKPDVEGYPFPRTDAQRRLEIRARIRLADVLVQRGAQRSERLLADIDARRLRVAAEFGDVLAARLQRLIDVDAFDGAGGAFQTVAVRDEEDSGAVEFLDEAGRDDADDARVPRLVAEHDDVAVGALRRDLLLGAAIDLVADLLALEVEGVEAAGEVVDLRLVAGGEQAQRTVRIPHPPRGVDAGRDGERERLRRDLLLLRRQQAAQRLARAGIDEAQPLEHDVAVLARQRHAVRDRRNGGEIEERIGVLAQQRAGDLEGDARPAQVVVRVVVRQLRVDDDAIGKDGRQLVVIGHDHVHPARSDVRDLFAVGDAAVDGDDEVGLVFVDDRLERGDGHPVSVRALGNVRRAADTVLAKGGRQDRRRADPVRIVVAEHGDHAARVAHPREAVDQFAHPAHPKGRKEMFARGREKAADLFFGVHAPREQDARRQLVQSAPGSDRARGFGLLGRKDKFGYDLFHAPPPFCDRSHGRTSCGGPAAAPCRTDGISKKQKDGRQSPRPIRNK